MEHSEGRATASEILACRPGRRSEQAAQLRGPSGFPMAGTEIDAWNHWVRKPSIKANFPTAETDSLTPRFVTYCTVCRLRPMVFWRTMKHRLRFDTFITYSST
jgi:hypothetical protein